MESAKGPRRSSGRSRRLRRDLWWGGILRGRGHREAPSGSSRAQAAARDPPPAGAPSASDSAQRPASAAQASQARDGSQRGASASGRGREKALACTILWTILSFCYRACTFLFLAVEQFPEQQPSMSHCTGYF